MENQTLSKRRDLNKNAEDTTWQPSETRNQLQSKRMVSLWKKKQKHRMQGAERRAALPEDPQVVPASG